MLQSVSASQQVCSRKVEEEAGRVARERKSESLRTSLTPLVQETTQCCDGKAEKNPRRAGQRRAGQGKKGRDRATRPGDPATRPPQDRSGNGYEARYF